MKHAAHFPNRTHGGSVTPCNSSPGEAKRKGWGMWNPFSLAPSLTPEKERKGTRLHGAKGRKTVTAHKRASGQWPRRKKIEGYEEDERVK